MLAIEVDFLLPAQRVNRVPDRLIELHGKPEVIVMGKGPEFRSCALDTWAYLRGVGLHFYNEVRPHSSLDNRTPRESIRRITGLTLIAVQ